MGQLNKILQRQLKRFRLSAEQPPNADDWKLLLESISSLYSQAQEDKVFLERSLELASAEMKERLEKDKDISIQLAQANKMASLGTLAAGVAHELNNPLGGVRGYAEMLLDSSNITVEQKKKLERIVSLTERMASIVSHLLKISRKTDKQSTDRFNLSSMISEMLELYRSKLKTENIELNVKLPQEEVFILVDFHRMTSVVQNLLNNSIDEFSRRKFPSDFQKKFTIEVTEFNPNEELIKLNFTDNAGGIPPGVIEKIFDPFFTTKEVGKGTGLGLSLTRQIAQELGGDLSVKSGEGQTTFQLSIKRSMIDQENSTVITSLKQANPQPSFERMPGAKFKLLLVDDEPDILEVLSYSLKDYFEVIKIGAPEQAIEYLKTDICDILMTDLKMPKITGDQLMGIAREINPKIGLVLMSGHVMATDEIDHLKQDDFVVISKPVPKTQELVKLIQSSLNFLYKNVG